MIKSYHDVWLHFVWATKYRVPVLEKSWQPHLFHFLKENAKKNKIYLDYINGVEDHIHLTAKLMSTQTLASIAKQLKGSSSYWINQQKLTKDPFSWQAGYYVNSISPNRVENVRNYIRKQEIHHAKQTFEEEIKTFTFYSDKNS